MTSNRETTIKTNTWDIFQQLWQTHDKQGIIFLETQDQAFKFPFQILLNKIMGFSILEITET